MSNNDPMTQEQLDAIQARVNGATRGPWEHDFCGNVDQVETRPNAASARIADNLTPGDADLIAHAPQDLLGLLAEVERLRALTTVDDAMVERIARALWGSGGIDGEEWRSLRECTREHYRADARFVLDAANGTREEA